MKPDFVFDQPHAVGITGARIDFLNKWLPESIRDLGLKTALDTGCGLGDFSRYLKDLGLEVSAFDGRSENVEEAKRRHADVAFRLFNVEEPQVLQMGSFDLVLCFGLLYHLENPFSAIRHLFGLTGKLLVLETMAVPLPFPSACIRHEPATSDQALNYVAMVPSVSGFVAMLQISGFPYVYSVQTLPDHEDYRGTLKRSPVRTVLAASKVPLENGLFHLLPKQLPYDPWLKPWVRGLLGVRKAVRHRLKLILSPFR